MPSIDVYAIIDVALFDSGIVRFVRYQTNPQGNSIYYGPASDGTVRFVHEVPGQVNANSQNYYSGQNIFLDVYYGIFKRDIVSGWPTNTFGPNPSIAKNLSNSTFPQVYVNQTAYFLFENMVTKTGLFNGRNVRDGGRSRIYRKPSNTLSKDSSVLLADYNLDVPDYSYGYGRYLTDVNIWINPGWGSGGDPYIYHFNPLGGNRTFSRGFHYYDRVLRIYNVWQYAQFIA